MVLQVLLLPLVSHHFSESPIISKLLVLHSKFHHSYLALLSSTSYTAAAFMLASGHPGLEIRLLHHCTLYSTVKYTTPQPLIEDARM